MFRFSKGFGAFGLSLEGPSVPVNPWTIGPWVAGTNTELTTSPTHAQAIAIGVNNPRIARHVTGLPPGQYRLRTHAQTLTAGSGFFRVSNDANLSVGEYGNISFGNTPDPIDLTFTMNIGDSDFYAGIVSVSINDGDSSQTDLNFELTKI